MRTVFFIFISFFAQTIFAQDSVFHQTKTISGDFIDFTVDNLDNYYLLTKKNQLKKYNSNGDSVAVFNDVRRYGKLHTIDATNPLKILLYYKSFSTIVVLDRFLNNVSSIDLRKQNIFQAKAIALSYDNNIWVYDEQNNKLKKIGEDGTVLSETADFRNIFDEVPSPVKIFDQDGFVYLYDPEKGIYVFDIYGSFKTKISYLGLTNLTIVGKTIIGIDRQQIIAYTTGTLTEKRLSIPSRFANEQKIVIRPGNLYLLKDGTVQLFTF